MINDLIAHFSNATDEQLHKGMGWYWEANHICQRIALHTKQDLFKVVGVMAALSPRNKWHRNISDTVDVIRKGNKAKVCTYGAMKRKALNCLKCDTEQEVFLELNGRKIQSFYKNILHPFKHDKVTVDVWAMRSVNFTGNLNKTNYNAIESAYQEASKVIGIRPHEMQAVVWGVVRDAKIGA